MKKYISFAIIALLLTFVVAYIFPTFNVNAETEINTISLHESTIIYRDNEIPFSNAAKKSEYENKTPTITVLTHGYDGSPIHFSNVSGVFAPNTASIINEIIEKTEINGGVNIYYAKQTSPKQLYKLSSSNYTRVDKEIDLIDDASKHIILLYEASNPTAGHKAVYDEFDNLLDTISLQYKALTGYLPIYNLIGHSRGGVINLMYATHHPYNVDKVISMGTPYRGSRLGMIDKILVLSKMLSTEGAIKPQGMVDILSETDPEDETAAVATTSATEIRNDWNAVYSQGVRASIISIGTMTDLSYVSKLLTEPEVSSYIKDESIIKILQKVINCANQVPGLVNFVFNFVDEIASIAQAFGLNTIADMGFEENSWTNVEIETYRKILQLVKLVNGELVIADDLFIDTDSQLGLGFADGISYTGFQRHIKILTDTDLTENKSYYNAPAIGHNVETMNADIVSFIGNSLTFGYSTNNVTTITDDEEKTISYNPPDTNLSYNETTEWIDFQLLKYTSNYNGNRQFILTNAQAEIYKYDTAGYLTQDTTANLSNYLIEAGDIYYIKVKPLNSSAKIKIVPTETILGTSSLSYNGNKAIQVKATNAGYYSIQIPAAINVTSNKQLFKHQFPSSNYCYIKYFSAQECISLYLSGGTTSTISISLTLVSNLENALSNESKLESSSNIRAFYLTNASSTTKEYTIFTFYNETVQAASFAVFSENGEITSTNTSGTNFNMYKFSVLSNQTVCLVFGQNGTEFLFGENIETHEWIINNSPVTDSEIYLPQENVTVSLNKYIDGVLIETNCSITESHNLFVGNTLNLVNCSVGSEIVLHKTTDASEVLKIYIMPMFADFYAVNNDDGVRIYPRLKDRVATDIPIENIIMKVLIDGSIYELSSSGLLIVESTATNSIRDINIQGVSYQIPLNTPAPKLSDEQQFSCSLSVNTHFNGGTGTLALPYQIKYKRHLKNIKYNPSASYYLLNDIDLNNEIWEPLPSFYGTFDGNNYKIKNLKFSSTNVFTSNLTYLGFFQKNYGTIQDIQFSGVQVELILHNVVHFGVVSGLCAQNAQIINCDVTSETIMGIQTDSYNLSAGVIVGYSQGGYVERCGASFYILRTSSSSYSNVGGVVGANTTGDVIRCYSEGRIEVYSTGDDVNLDVGGLIGRCAYSDIYGSFGYVLNCYSTCDVYVETVGITSYVYIGGLIGVLKEARVRYCYATGEVLGKNHTGYVVAGGFAGLIENCTNQGYVKNCFTFGDVYARGNYSGAERRYSFFGRLCGDESNNSFLNIYYNSGSGFKEGLTGTEITWNTSWYVGKTEAQLKTVSFQTGELGLSSTYWNFTEGQFPTLK